MKSKVLASAAVSAACVISHPAGAQCARGWEAIGELPGVLPRSGSDVVEAAAWDPDGDGPLPEYIVANWATAGNLPLGVIGAWDGTRWVELGRGSRALSLGEFRAVRGGPLYMLQCGAVARLDHPGAEWVQSIAPGSIGGTPGCNARALLPDGSLVIGGGFTGFRGLSYLARWMPGESLWREFGVPNAGVTAIHVEGDDVLIAGDFTDIGGVGCGGFARYSMSEGAWHAMPGWPYARANASHVEVTGAGVFVNQVRGIVRTDDDGGTPTQLMGGRFRFVNDMAETPSGGVHVCGTIMEFEDFFATAQVATWTPTTGAWTPVLWNTYGDWFGGGMVRRITTAADESLIATSMYRSNPREMVIGDDRLEGVGVVRLSPGGGVAEVLGEGFAQPPRAMTAMPDGTVLFGGEFRSVGNVPAKWIARWDPATRVFSSVGADALGPCFGMYTTRAGRVIAACAGEDGNLSVYRMAAAGDNWERLDAGWQTIGSSEWMRFLETPAGDLVVIWIGATRVLDSETGVWRNGPSYTGNGLLSVLPSAAFGLLVSGSGHVFGGRTVDQVHSWDPVSGVVSPIVGAPSRVESIVALDGERALVKHDGQLKILDTRTLAMDDAGGYSVSLAGSNAVRLADGDVLLRATWSGPSGSSSSQPQVARWDAQTHRIQALGYLNAIGQPFPMALTTGGDLVVASNFTSLDLRASMPYAAVYRNAAAACPADVDCRPGLDADDVSVFFDAFDAGRPLADIDLDRDVDGDDVLAFWSSWEAGC
ncbi:MAG: GC-type dockerin domain-anchored protein [Phycisphaerales bacterium]